MLLMLGCGDGSDGPALDASDPAASAATDAAVVERAADVGASDAASSMRDANTPALAAAASDGATDARNADAASPSSDAGPPPASGDAELPGWQLVWRDEFDGAEGTPPSPERWQPETGGHGFGNNQQEFDTDRTENAALDGQGQLVITARKESYMGKSYTSARLKTQGKFERAYGRFEARMRLPRGQGIWPAFWMLGSDIGSAGWPTCGEIDIMENIGREPSRVHGTVHGPGYSGGAGIGASFDLTGKAFADDYHVFAIEWEEQVIRWYVDGKLYQTRTPRDLPSGAKWVYDHSFFVLLNLAVGGQWPGNPDSTTTFPQRLTVDYVRVYARSNQ